MNFNLFNIFDPLNKNLSINYFLFFMILMIHLNFYYNKKMNFENKILMMEKKNKSIIFLFNMIFMLILLINMMNLLPYMYSISNHISFTLNITLMLWMLSIFFSLYNNFNILFMNLSPNKTSMYLILIINLIEFNSMMFSILSISMRLMINMMMGHLIFFMLSMKILIYIYMMIEMTIIIIQSYIFITLNIINFNNMM